MESNKPITKYEIFTLKLHSVNQNPIEIDNKEINIKYGLKYGLVERVKANNSHPTINNIIPKMTFIWLFSIGITTKNITLTNL